MNLKTTHLPSILHSGQGSVNGHQHTTAADSGAAVHYEGTTAVKQVHQSQELKQQCGSRSGA